MVLSPLQTKVMRTLAPNRSETSYFAGGVVLNRDWPRRSDDIDVFQDTDESVAETADLDIDTLRNAGFRVTADIKIYGLVEATVSDDGQSTLIQWMSETRWRYFPLVRDPAWGVRLHQADLAVNKVLAASTRTKARDFVDLVLIARNMCPLGPLVMAAAGKPPHLSPQTIVDEIRRRGLSVADEEFASVAGMPDAWTAADIRDGLVSALDRADRYLSVADTDVIGRLAVDTDAVPVEVGDGELSDKVVVRAPTREPEEMPLPGASLFGGGPR
ncbi:hypothetical protein CKO28_18305 [Rhodovibrio sodomensis]|uniref:Nucleotidyl transferase AbiEii/AbiGii toxin family protein n=1 Tax=Rhodovibrio sodomensis TaxID=1088 RepID=A0ABS1DHQ0_9PROT|nr:hypothetical protein [Rhodovibrio sodomensis]MBK1669990.1 hypothetical protein [Rhodovibrio sodomensis]